MLRDTGEHPVKLREAGHFACWHDDLGHLRAREAWCTGGVAVRVGGRPRPFRRAGQGRGVTPHLQYCGGSAGADRCACSRFTPLRANRPRSVLTIDRRGDRPRHQGRGGERGAGPPGPTWSPEEMARLWIPWLYLPPMSRTLSVSSSPAGGHGLVTRGAMHTQPGRSARRLSSRVRALSCAARRRPACRPGRRSGAGSSPAAQAETPEHALVHWINQARAKAGLASGQRRRST